MTATASPNPPPRAALQRHHLWIFAALLLVASIPYYFSLANTFTDDDWMFLHYYRNRSLGSLFSPQVLWFYRPLQSVMFAVFFKAFGLDPLPYNLASLALYFAGCAAWYALLARLLRGFGLALLALFFLVVNWQFCDVLFWKSNYGGLIAWLGGLGVLHAALADARRASWRWLALGSAAFLASLLGKETAVNIPLLAGLVYLYEWRAGLSAEPRRTLVRAGRRLAPLFVLLAAYLVFHVACVKDIETVHPKLYGFAKPWAVVPQYLFALNHLLIFFGRSPVLAAMNPAWQFVAGKALFLPLLVWAYALLRRDAALIFALLYASVALTPQIFSVNFHTARYYLLPASGTALVWAVLVWRAGEAIAKWPAPAMRGARIAGLALLALAALRSEAQLFTVVAMEGANTRIMGRFYAYITAQRKALPPDVCLVFDGIGRDVNDGLGLRQMTKILLGSERAEAIKNGSRMSEDFARRINTQYPHKILIWQDPRGKVLTRPLGNVRVLRGNPGKEKSGS